MNLRVTREFFFAATPTQVRKSNDIYLVPLDFFRVPSNNNGK